MDDGFYATDIFFHLPESFFFGSLKIPNDADFMKEFKHAGNEAMHGFRGEDKEKNKNWEKSIKHQTDIRRRVSYVGNDESRTEDKHKKRESDESELGRDEADNRDHRRVFSGDAVLFHVEDLERLTANGGGSDVIVITPDCHGLACEREVFLLRETLEKKVIFRKLRENRRGKRQDRRD